MFQQALRLVNTIETHAKQQAMVFGLAQLTDSFRHYQNYLFLITHISNHINYALTSWVINHSNNMQFRICCDVFCHPSDFWASGINTG